MIKNCKIIGTLSTPALMLLFRASVHNCKTNIGNEQINDLLVMILKRTEEFLSLTLAGGLME